MHITTNRGNPGVATQGYATPGYESLALRAAYPLAASRTKRMKRKDINMNIQYEKAQELMKKEMFKSIQTNQNE